MNELLAQLASAGVVNVLISYSGSGDEGYIEDFSLDPETPLELSGEMIRTLEDWAYDVLNDHFAGWEINEGSSGTITLDVLARKATISHDENVIQTRNETLDLEVS